LNRAQETIREKSRPSGKVGSYPEQAGPDVRLQKNSSLLTGGRKQKDKGERETGKQRGDSFDWPPSAVSMRTNLGRFFSGGIKGEISRVLVRIISCAVTRRRNLF